MITQGKVMVEQSKNGSTPATTSFTVLLTRMQALAGRLDALERVVQAIHACLEGTGREACRGVICSDPWTWRFRWSRLHFEWGRWSYRGSGHTLPCWEWWRDHIDEPVFASRFGIKR